MKLRFHLVAFLFSVMIMSGCEKQHDKLFKLLTPDVTGISFNNQIVDNDTFNILTHEYIYNGAGVGVSDFNNDGLADLFFAGNTVPNKIYLNKGDLTFQDITAQAGVNVPGRWNSGVAIADINNDGWKDIYVCATMKPDSADRLNMLFINNGPNENGIPTFTDQAASYGVQDGGFSVTAAFFDYDRDNDLDLYLLINQRMGNVPTNFRPKIEDGSAPNNDKLYRNNDNGTFTDVTLQAGIKLEGFGLGLCISDLNSDGWPDIYVSNDYLSNDVLYINNGNGTFTNRIAELIGHQSEFSMGNDAADINNDGLTDIITVDMLPETNNRKKTTIGNKNYLRYINNERYGYEYQYVRNMLHINNGAGQGIKFSEIGQLSGVHQTEWSWAPLFADFDNDGFKDLIVTNGFPKDVTDKDFANYRTKVGNIASLAMLEDSIPVVKVPNYAFKNNGNLTFADHSEAWGINTPSFSNGAAFADLDNDGDLEFIINNINSEAFVFENTLYSSGTDNRAKSFVRFKLNGRNHIGASVTLYANGQVQLYENTVYRGFLSSVEDMVHFGLGSQTKIDSVAIRWPDGNTQLVTDVKINQVNEVIYRDAPRITSVSPQTGVESLFKKVDKIDFVHCEDDKIDFNLQRTVPHKFSQSGPGISVGDINNDGREDLVIGGSVNYETAFFLQHKDGTFSSKSKLSRMETKKEEDEGLLLFDADNDNDLDLYVVSGSLETFSTPEAYQDRLYKNNGKGDYELDKNALPATLSSGSCVRAADFDGDGDLDLFVGGRVVPGSYPLAPESYLLRNDRGKFSDVTMELCSALRQPGMITDAIWSDFNNDRKIDLILVGEFTPVMFFQNLGNKLTRLQTDIDNTTGWWNSIVGADFDRDGDIDYAAGNLGLNNNYQVTKEYPLKVYAKDFDDNGSVDPILACYIRESMLSFQKKLYPVHFWDELNSQSPKFRKRFARYRQYGRAALDEVVTPEETKDALVLEANHMGTSYIENLGGNKFKISVLPMLTQIAPVNGMIADDIDADGNPDLVMVGNDYGNEVFSGRYDAFCGLVLKGDGKGNFKTLPPAETGFYVPGDGKGLVKLSTAAEDLLLATQNRGRIQAFSTNNSIASSRFTPWPLEYSAELIFSDGSKQRVEFYYGSGYLSQSTRSIRLPRKVKEVLAIDSQGNERHVTPDGL